MASGTFDIIHPGHGLYLEKAKELGGENAELIVVVAKDSTVKKRKRIPIINENQRLEMVKYLKPVNEAYLGHDGDMFKIVEEIKNVFFWTNLIFLGITKFEIEIRKLQRFSF